MTFDLGYWIITALLVTLFIIGGIIGAVMLARNWLNKAIYEAIGRWLKL